MSMTQETVLVLGAGASAPYDFPTAEQLMFDVGAATRAPRVADFGGDGDAVGTLLHHGFEREEISLFREQLRKSGQRSVDIFLEYNPNERWMRLGKIAMASVLVKCEDPDIKNLQANYREKGRWYHVLWDTIKGSSPEEPLEADKLSVISFNYDRSLEFALCHNLMGSFSLSRKVALRHLSQIRIVHVHGILADLPESANAARQEDGTVFRKDFQQDWEDPEIGDAADGIEIVPSTTVHTPAYFKARELMDAAERVVFLGFGFIQENVDRLRLGLREPGKLLGTGYGLTGPRRNYVENQLGVQLGGPTVGILEYIENSDALS